MVPGSPLVPRNTGTPIVITALRLGGSGGNFENRIYIPLPFACWMSLVIGIVYAYLGWPSLRVSAAPRRPRPEMGEAIQSIEPSSGAETAFRDQSTPRFALGDASPAVAGSRHGAQGRE